MKWLAAFLVFICIAQLGSSAFAQNTNQGGYISGHIGGNSRPDAQTTIFGFGPGDLTFDPGFVLGGAIGYDFGNNVRLEGEIAYRSNDVDGVVGGSWNFSGLSFMGNGYYDINLNSPLKPYLGGGVGFALFRSEIEVFGATSGDDDTLLAYQLMAGLGYDINPKATITLGYRYFATAEDPTFSVQGFESEYSSHEFLLGARFRFN